MLVLLVDSLNVFPSRGYTFGCIMCSIHIGITYTNLVVCGCQNGGFRDESSSVRFERRVSPSFIYLYICNVYSRYSLSLRTKVF